MEQVRAKSTCEMKNSTVALKWSSTVAQQEHVLTMEDWCGRSLIPGTNVKVEGGN